MICFSSGTVASARADAGPCDHGGPRKSASTETGSTSRHGSRPLSLSPMSQIGPTPAQPRTVPVPPTRCGRVLGGGSRPLFLHICKCEPERCTSGAQLLCKVITHKREIPREAHICSPSEAALRSFTLLEGGAESGWCPRHTWTWGRRLGAARRAEGVRRRRWERSQLT